MQPHIYSSLDLLVVQVEFFIASYAASAFVENDLNTSLFLTTTRLRH
jgi:hypothetical protein